jgi:hypothetical protein
MRAVRVFVRALLIALAAWPAAATTASAQILAADVNGDGVRDRIETRQSATELVVQLSDREPAQHLRARGPILDVLVADVDRDGDSDLIVTTATTRGERNVGLVVWTNAGRGRFVARAAHAAARLRHLRHGRLVDRSIPIDIDFSGDAMQLFVLPATVAAGRAADSEPLAPSRQLAARAHPHTLRPPRGPPTPFTLS